VSASPGKTKMLNVFEIGIGDWGLGIRGHQSPIPNAESPTVYLLDLPGYGYARTSKVERAGFRPLLDGTLNRSTLSGVVWLLDIRHDLSKEDREIRDLLSGIGVRTLAALTKGDKLPRGTGRKREAELAAELELDDDQVLLTSAKTGTGLDELREALAGLIGKAAG